MRVLYRRGSSLESSRPLLKLKKSVLKSLGLPRAEAMTLCRDGQAYRPSHLLHAAQITCRNAPSCFYPCDLCHSRLSALLCALCLRGGMRRPEDNAPTRFRRFRNTRTRRCPAIQGQPHRTMLIPHCALRSMKSLRRPGPALLRLNFVSTSCAWIATLDGRQNDVQWLHAPPASHSIKIKRGRCTLYNNKHASHIVADDVRKGGISPIAFTHTIYPHHLQRVSKISSNKPGKAPTPNRYATMTMH